MTTPGYNPNIPQKKDIFGTSADPFQINFETLATAFAVDHVGLTTGANGANHKTIHLQQSSAGAQTGKGDFSVYSRPVEKQTTQPFMRFQGNQDEFRYVNYQIYPLEEIKKPNATNPTTVQTQFFTFLPGNFIVYFGKMVNSGTASSYLIELNPTICKKIVAVNCTGFNNAGTLASVSTNMTPDKKFVTGVLFSSAAGGIIVPQVSAYYTIIGNAGP